MTDRYAEHDAKMTRILAIRDDLKKIRVPSFVESVQPTNSFADKAGHDYSLQIRLKLREHDLYKHKDGFRPISNHPFNWPKDDDELRLQLASAITLAVAHETIEQVTGAGTHWCNPHMFKGGSEPDTLQWMVLNYLITGALESYGRLMSV